MRTYKRWLTVGAVLVALLLVSAIPVSADPGTTWYVNVALGTNNDVCGQNPGAFACKTIEYVLHDRWVPAQPGDTIVVAAGVYPESIVIDIPNLTVKGPQFGVDPTVAGARTVLANEAIITGSGGLDYSVRIGRDTTAAGGGTGVTFDGFLLRGVAALTTRAVYANRDNPTISNNIIEVANFAGDGIALLGEHYPINSATISHNYIKGTVSSVRAAIRVDSYLGIGAQATIKNVAISGNKVAATGANFYDQGVMVARSTGTALAVSNVSITDNVFSGIGEASSAGIDIYSDASGVAGVKDVTITGNTIDPWAWGIMVDDLSLGVVDATTIAVHNNSIVGNTIQVENAGTGVLNAECNWWGDVDGPVPAKVIGLVDYDPWVTLGLSAVDGKAEANGSDAEEITASLVCGGSAVPDAKVDFTKVDFGTDLGFFTLTLLADVEPNVPLVDGKAKLNLYSQWVGRATLSTRVAGVGDWVEEANLVTFYPEMPSISYPPHRSTIRQRRPLFSWTASPATEGVRVFYRLRLVKVRPLPREVVFKVRTDRTSYRSVYLDGRRYLLKVKACAKFFDPTVTVCSRWEKSRFRIR